MSDAEIIHNVLDCLAKPGINYAAEVYQTIKTSKGDIRAISDKMVDEGLMAMVNGQYSITTKGRAILSSGGYMKHCQELESNRLKSIQEKEDDRERQKLNDKKMLLDIERIEGDIARSNLQTEVLKGQIEALENSNKYFWVPYAISFFALVFSALGYINSRSMRNEAKRKQDSEYNKPATPATTPVLLKSSQVDSAKTKNK